MQLHHQYGFMQPPAGVLVEHNSNDMLMFSTDRDGHPINGHMRTAARSLEDQTLRSFEIIPNKGHSVAQSEALADLSAPLSPSVGESKWEQQQVPVTSAQRALSVHPSEVSVEKHGSSIDMDLENLNM